MSSVFPGLQDGPSSGDWRDVFAGRPCRWVQSAAKPGRSTSATSGVAVTGRPTWTVQRTTWAKALATAAPMTLLRLLHLQMQVIRVDTNKTCSSLQGYVWVGCDHRGAYLPAEPCCRVVSPVRCQGECRRVCTGRVGRLEGGVSVHTLQLLASRGHLCPSDRTKEVLYHHRLEADRRKAQTICPFLAHIGCAQWEVRHKGKATSCEPNAVFSRPLSGTAIIASSQTLNEVTSQYVSIAVRSLLCALVHCSLC